MLPMNVAPLDGIRVLDLTRLLPGGICSLLLADQGAEVIKIEQPNMGDYARWFVPRIGDYAAIFHALNRNKASLALDLKGEAGREIFHKLLATTDVLIESFRPNVLPRLGLDYASLSAIKPNLIMASLSGYGQAGDWANRAGHDLNFAALSGILAAGNGQPLPIQALDIGGAYLTAFAITTALFQRERRGVGAYIDAALLDAGLSLTTVIRAEAAAKAQAPQASGELLTGGYACYRAYTCADGEKLTLAALEPKFWETFCKLAERDDLAKISYLDPDEQPALIAALDRLFAERSLQEWLDCLGEHETCVTPILDVLAGGEHPSIAQRGAHYEADGVAHTRTPFKLGAIPDHQPAPALGGDTERLLGEVGYTAAELADLRAAGVIG